MLGQEVDFVEKFALAEDRRQFLAELIPGTEDYYYFHCLHFQNEGQFGEADAMLNAWRTKLGDNSESRGMWLRQQLLNYPNNPQQTLTMLREQLGLQLDHQAPSRDRAAQLPTVLDNGLLELNRNLTQSLAQDASLGGIETSALPLLFDRKLSDSQLRSLLGRLTRADTPGVLARIAQELKLKDSKGFGWASVHALLTLQQLDELLQLVPALIENESFIRAYAARLAPPAGSSLADRSELREYLQRLVAWSDRLPTSQNSFKAYVIGHLLRLSLTEGKFDRDLFLKYLALPRQASYYNVQRINTLRVAPVDLGYALNPQVPLVPISDDHEIVRRYLEHFLQADASADAFAEFLNREYLDRVLAETMILYGIGDAATWYAKLPPVDQKMLRERIELRFAPQKELRYAVEDDVQLAVELKNVNQLIVKIYEVSTLSYFRNKTTAIGADLDLDGLVANAERKFQYQQPADRRHTEHFDFPEMSGRGVWIVDFLGGGGRSRALIQKGQLTALERLSDAGQVYRIVDEAGQAVPNAYIEMNGRAYQPNDKGDVLLPYAEQNLTRNLLLVQDDFASQLIVLNHIEQYELQAGFLVDRQALVAGKQAQVVVNARLTVNQVPVSIELLDNAKLTVVATDSDGIETSQHVGSLELSDSDEFVHNFLVPQRLRRLRFELSGSVDNRSRGVRDVIKAKYDLECNGIAGTNQITDYFLQSTPTGFQLLTLGRNGEPDARQPVSIQVKLQQLTKPLEFSLATDANGIVQLGDLQNVAWLTASAAGNQAARFDLTRFHRNWPTSVHTDTTQAIELPLGMETTSRDHFSLIEMREGVPYANASAKIESQSGSLKIQGLSAGDYVLHDHQAGQQVMIRVAAATTQHNHVLAEHRILQTETRAPLVIRKAAVEGDALVMAVDGANEFSRVHVVADPFWPGTQRAATLQLPYPALAYRKRTAPTNRYIDSLRLDEEYSYILNRQGIQKFPGNMLTQPSLLVNPWEVSVTQNETQAAMAGDAIPAMPAPAAESPDSRRKSRAMDTDPSNVSQSYDFLSRGAVVLANVEISDGSARVPLVDLRGFGTVTVVAVHPTAVDSRMVTLPVADLGIRDQRLANAFAADQHLAQTQQIQVLPAGEKVGLGDARTRRVQTYANIASVFQLYETLLGEGSDWHKFRFIADWHNLSDEERQAHYNEMACHELNFFLYHKDRKFFDAVVKPLIAQKLDKQLVDDWLLGRPLDQYTELWRVQRLNTLERVLLAERLEAKRAGTLRWLSELPDLDPQWRQQRFETALSGSELVVRTSELMRGRFGRELAKTDPGRLEAMSLGERPADADMGGMGASGARRSPARGGGKAFEMERMAVPGFGGFVPNFQSLDQTREWADTQFYRVRLSGQVADLIPANPFWRELLEHGGKPFLTRQLDIPCSNLHEALCALAVIDLPLDATEPVFTVEENQLFVTANTPTIAYVESIEATESKGDESESILVGQDIYLGLPGIAESADKPVEQPLLTGIPYRASVVVTNPSSSQRVVAVLTQLPAGALPLAGGKLTQSQTLTLGPYSTGKIEYRFYFPAAGEFEHYAAQIHQTLPNGTTQFVTATKSNTLRVLDEPESVDETTWNYVAAWGTDTQVLDYLKTANLRELELGLIAFRMQDREFFDSVTDLLSQSGDYNAALWAYAVKHNAPLQIAQLLHNRPDFVQQLGIAFSSALIRVDPQWESHYEHLDYRPLVAARSHQLGLKPKILNSSLHAQYHRLLDLIAHQDEITPEQRLSLCYYMLLQNRIGEALTWFESVQVDRLETKMQYDYFTAYLDFYRGEYTRAAELAGRYAEHPVPRWRELFGQIVRQVRERETLLAGESLPDDRRFTAQDAGQRMLTDTREAQQAAAAAVSPVLELDNSDGRLVLTHRNLDEVQVNFYLMDIELLFSRNPFVVRGQDKVPVIQANLSNRLPLDGTATSREIEIPVEIRNRNLLVEVSGQGISRSTVITANSLNVNLVERMGRLQVLGDDRVPVTGAYVKVYAQHADGAVRFYKDGYTDLRGQFDYATLSTSELDTAQKFAILVIDEKRGAVVREAGIPTR
ncbi:MAG: hypothetical protein R3C53_13725 [Pirellulaceae bacterium]